MTDSFISPLLPSPDMGSRRLFPGLEPQVYANHASLSPPSLPVRDAVQRSLDGYATKGMAWYSEEVACRERLRARLAGLIGACSDDLALVANTSAGVLAVALCLPWQRGDRVVVFEGEFPTNINALATGCAPPWLWSWCGCGLKTFASTGTVRLSRWRTKCVAACA